MYLSLRGIYIPRLDFGPNAGWLFAALLVLIPLCWRGSGLFLNLWRVLTAVAIYFVAIAAIALAAGITPLVDLPELKGLNFRGGMRVSAEFASLMIGIVIYTSVFIGEVIRGGIDAVPKGQLEAGRALGLSERHTLFRIVMPQALRIIIPPLTSQYLLTVKNTTLAIAVGFPELSLVMNTVINQTGQAIESVLILLAAFLTVSLSVSFFMNWYNRHVALVTR